VKSRVVVFLSDSRDVDDVKKRLADIVDKSRNVEDIDDWDRRPVVAVKVDAVMFGTMLSTPEAEAEAGDEESETSCIVVGFVRVIVNPIAFEA
jgi:hypothetical protein